MKKIFIECQLNNVKEIKVLEKYDFINFSEMMDLGNDYRLVLKLVDD